jgi:hypothetical protein
MRLRKDIFSATLALGEEVRVMSDKIVVSDGELEAFCWIVGGVFLFAFTAPLWITALAVVITPGVILAKLIHPAIATGISILWAVIFLVGVVQLSKSLPEACTYTAAAVVYAVCSLVYLLFVVPLPQRPDVYWMTLDTMIAAAVGAGISWLLLKDADWFEY